MNDNYPPGAAHDPDAPYNQPESREELAAVRVAVEKETHLLVRDGEDGDPEALYASQEMSVADCLRACAIVCRALRKEGRISVDGIFLKALLDDCEGWEETDVEVEFL